MPKDLEEELKKKLAEEEEDQTDSESDDEDDDQNFIRKDQPQDTKSEEIQGVIDGLKKLKNLIRPNSNQQRNLDRETGGLEEEEQKESSEKDVWDDRSEEVDKMGSTDTFNTTGMKSVVWKQKKDRIARKRAEHHHAQAAGAAQEMKNTKSQSSFDNMGYVEKLKHLKQDRSHENNQGGRGI